MLDAAERPVRADAAAVGPAPLVAVTTARNLYPMSARVNAYVPAVAPGTSTQFV